MLELRADTALADVNAQFVGSHEETASLAGELRRYGGARCPVESRRGQRATTKFQLEMGAVQNWKGCDNLTPLYAAHRAGMVELAAWLSERGAASAAGKVR
jgi:hypothetical protein